MSVMQCGVHLYIQTTPLSGLWQGEGLRGEVRCVLWTVCVCCEVVVEMWVEVWVEVYSNIRWGSGGLYTAFRWVGVHM